MTEAFEVVDDSRVPKRFSRDVRELCLGLELQETLTSELQIVQVQGQMGEPSRTLARQLDGSLCSWVPVELEAPRDEVEEFTHSPTLGR